MDPVQRLEGRRTLAGIAFDTTDGTGGTETVRFPRGLGTASVRQLVTDSKGNAYVAAVRALRGGLINDYDLVVAANTVKDVNGNAALVRTVGQFLVSQ